MGKKHPLELFREHPEGFENASRQRRTVTGRIVGTSLRPTPATGNSRSGRLGSAKGAASRGSAAAQKPRKTSASARGPRFSLEMLRPTNKKALYSVLTVFGAFALYLIGANTGGPALKMPSEEIFSTAVPISKPAATPVAPAATEFAILAATYAGSEHGQEIARITRDVLREDGYPRAEVVGYPGKAKGSFDRYELTVGRAAHEADLGALLEQVRRYPGPPNDPTPFRDAYVVEVPAVLRSGG